VATPSHKKKKFPSLLGDLKSKTPFVLVARVFKEEFGANSPKKKHWCELTCRY
jgi:hypothetical protein